MLRRAIVITKGAFLLLDPKEGNTDHACLIAWASLQSIARIRRNSTRPELVSVIFKATSDQQEWVLNLLMPQHESFCAMIVTNLTNIGVENKKRKIKNPVKKKIAEIEVTKSSVKAMDIGQLLDNMQMYEQAVVEMDPACGGKGFELSSVQTLLTLY